MSHNKIPTITLCGSTAINLDAVQWSDYNNNAVIEENEVSFADRPLSRDEYLCFKNVASFFERRTAIPRVTISGDSAKLFYALGTELEALGQAYADVFADGQYSIQVTLSSSSLGDSFYGYSWSVSGKLKNGAPFSEGMGSMVGTQVGGTSATVRTQVENALKNAQSKARVKAK